MVKGTSSTAIGHIHTKVYSKYTFYGYRGFSDVLGRGWVCISCHKRGSDEASKVPQDAIINQDIVESCPDYRRMATYRRMKVKYD